MIMRELEFYDDFRHVLISSSATLENQRIYILKIRINGA